MLARAAGFLALSCLPFNCVWVRKCGRLEAVTYGHSVPRGATSTLCFNPTHQMSPWSPEWAPVMDHSVLDLNKGQCLENRHLFSWWTKLIHISYLFLCLLTSVSSFTLLGQEERQSMDAAHQGPQILWSYWETMVTELAFLHMWHFSCCSVKTTQVPEPGTPAPGVSHLERERKMCLQCRTRTSRWVRCRTHRFFDPRGLVDVCFELLLHLSFLMTPHCFVLTLPTVGENRDHHVWAL